jgi:hypothetical protein
MHRLVVAAIAAAAFAGAMTLAGNRAEAITLPGGIAASPATQTEPVALVCRRVWNGWAWVRNCYRTGPRYYGYAPGYYGRPYWGGRRYYRGW